MAVEILSGKAYWTSIVQPNTTFEPVWSVDVALTGDQLDKAKALGLPIKNKGDERGDFVKIKRNVTRRDGTSNNQPIMVDSQKRVMTDTLVGNGSDVNVAFKTYDWEYGGKSGVGADLAKLQVVNLIPYANDDAFDVVPDGYQAAADTAADDNNNDDDIPF